MMYEDITDRQQAEKARRESEARYRLLFEQAPDAIFLEDIEDRILGVNLNACKLMGYSREELLNITLANLQASEVGGKSGQVIKNEIRNIFFADQLVNGINC